MQKVSIGFTGLSAAASSVLIQSVVEQLTPEGVVVIDRDENGADITVFDEGEPFVLPSGDALTVKGGIPSIKWSAQRAWHELFGVFDRPCGDAALKGLRIMEPISSLKPRIRAGSSSPASDNTSEAWLIELSGDRFVFNRLIDGEVNESYRPMETDEALLAAVSVIQGFQPPRCLYRLDKPAG